MIETRDIEKLTQAERQELLGKLLRLSVGVVKLDGAEDDWCVVFRTDGVIQPHCTQSIAVSPQLFFRPRKLIIDEPVYDLVEREEIYRTVHASRTVDNWRVESEVVSTLDRVIEHKRSVVQPRGIWIVHGAFVGQRVQFPGFAGISGDEFGPQGALSFRDVCEPGLYITITVENNSNHPAEFFGLLLGNTVESARSESEIAPAVMDMNGDRNLDEY